MARVRLCTVVGVLVTFALPAVAMGNNYGIATLNGSAFGGSVMTIHSSRLDAPVGYFADNDSWVNYNGYWVEAGMVVGCNGGVCSNAPYFFWNDNRPGGGYHEHSGGLAQLNTDYNDQIIRTGTGTWGVSVGTFGGTSTNNFNYSNNIQTGTEVLDKYASEHTCSSSRNLAWYDQYGGYHAVWSDSTGNAGRSQDLPPYAYWVVPQQWLRDYINTSC